jgi:hypothetical protein
VSRSTLLSSANGSVALGRLRRRSRSIVLRVKPGVMMLCAVGVALILGVVGVALIARPGDSDSGGFALLSAGILLVSTGLDYTAYRNRRRP